MFAAKPAADDLREQSLELGRVMAGIAQDIQGIGFIGEHCGQQGADYAFGIELIEGAVDFQRRRLKTGLGQLGQGILRSVFLAPQIAGQAAVEAQAKLRQMLAKYLGLTNADGRQDVVIVCPE
ncbi:hypothetical protein PSCICN_19300 [Pseudomonas cichorii]|nr:hypothetical protein PSCICN_19300 [Pseudomonas cichorii]